MISLGSTNIPSLGNTLRYITISTALEEYISCHVMQRTKEFLWLYFVTHKHMSIRTYVPTYRYTYLHEHLHNCTQDHRRTRTHTHICIYTHTQARTILTNSLCFPVELELDIYLLTEIGFTPGGSVKVQYIEPSTHT
jgi:hypothetical protein